MPQSKTCSCIHGCFLQSMTPDRPLAAEASTSQGLSSSGQESVTTQGGAQRVSHCSSSHDVDPVQSRYVNHHANKPAQEHVYHVTTHWRACFFLGTRSYCSIEHSINLHAEPQRQMAQCNTGRDKQSTSMCMHAVTERGGLLPHKTCWALCCIETCPNN